jgi:hypothetical protein
VKSPALSPLPAPFVTRTGPDFALPGSVKRISVSDTNSKLAFVPPTVTAVVPVKNSPITDTRVPAGPLEGERAATTGLGGTSSSTMSPSPTPSERAAPEAPESSTWKVSNSSTSTSPLTGTEMVLEIVDPEKERLPDLA